MEENTDGITKVCTKCGVEKPLDEFEKAKRGKHGRRADCKQCRNKYIQERYKNDPEFREKVKQRSVENHRKDPEANRRKAKEWADANHERVLEKHKHYWHNVVDKEVYNARKREHRKERYQNDPEFREKRKAGSRHSARKRRDKLKGAEGSYTQQEWEAIKKRQDYCCLRCGRREPEIALTVDHVVPVSKGGSNTADNLQGLCLDCNMRKCNKIIDYREGTGVESTPVPKQLRLSL